MFGYPEQQQSLLGIPKQDLFSLGVGLLQAGGAGANWGTGLAQGLGNMSATEQQRQQQAMEWYKYQQEQALNQQKMKMAQQEMAMNQSKFNLAKQQAMREMAQQEALSKGVKGLIGERAPETQTYQAAGTLLPGIPQMQGNQFQKGSGLLGGEIKPTDYQYRLAGLMAETGNPTQAVQLMSQINKPQDETSFVKNLRAVGIDPQSKEGKDLYMSSLLGKPMALSVDPATGQVSFTQGAAAGSASSPKERYMAQADAKLITDARSSAKDAFIAKGQLQNALVAAKNINPDLVGPIAGKISPYFSQDAQTLQTLTTQNALLSRTLQNMPGSAMSDRDMTILQISGGRVEQNKKTIIAATKALLALVDKRIEYNTFIENFYKKNGTLLGANEAFSKTYKPNEDLQNAYRWAEEMKLKNKEKAKQRVKVFIAPDGTFY